MKPGIVYLVFMYSMLKIYSNKKEGQIEFIMDIKFQVYFYHCMERF